jgi:hypothetical protein
VSITLKCQFPNVDNLKKCLASKKCPIGCSVYGGSQQISTLLGIFYKYISMNVENLSSE